MHPAKAIFILLLVVILGIGLFFIGDRFFNLTGRLPKDANPATAAVSEQPQLESLRIEVLSDWAFISRASGAKEIAVQSIRINGQEYLLLERLSGGLCLQKIEKGDKATGINPTP